MIYLIDKPLKQYTMENNKPTPSGTEIIIQLVFLGIMIWCLIQSLSVLKSV